MIRSDLTARSDDTWPEQTGTGELPAEPEVRNWALEWVRSEARAFLFTNEALDLLWANAAAHVLLEEGSLMTVVDGRIEMDSRDRQTTLVDLVRTCDREGRFCHFPVEGTDGFAILKAQQIGDKAKGKVVALSIRGQGGGERLRYADLKAIFGLSEGEYLVLAALLEGRKPEEISTARDVSVETVRTQIRNIYSKVGATSRESLFAALRHFMS